MTSGRVTYLFINSPLCAIKAAVNASNQGNLPIHGLYNECVCHAIVSIRAFAQSRPLSMPAASVTYLFIASLPPKHCRRRLTAKNCRRRRHPHGAQPLTKFSVPANRHCPQKQSVSRGVRRMSVSARCWSHSQQDVHRRCFRFLHLATSALSQPSEKLHQTIFLLSLKAIDAFSIRSRCGRICNRICIALACVLMQSTKNHNRVMYI